MRNDLGRLLRQDAKADVRFTTMFDLYALHDGFPGAEWRRLGRHVGEEKTREYLEKAGFNSVGKHELSHDIQNNWYVVRK